MKRTLMVECVLKGLGAEKLINAAGKQGIALEWVERKADRSLQIRCSQREYAALSALATEKGYILSPPEAVGLLGWIRRLQRRWGLALGMGICLIFMIYAMGFLWQIEIENAGAYEGEVRLFLEEAGIHPGLRRREVDIAALREQLEWRLPKVKWVRAEFSGVTLKIHLEEGTPPPDVAGSGERGDLIASEDGLLMGLITYAGTPQAKAGDFVKKGQILIKGEERGTDGQMLPVQARGQAMARLWVTVQAEVSLTQFASHPTGREQQRRIILGPFFSISLDDTPDFLSWDVERKDQFTCGVWLPLGVRREQYMEISLEKEERDMDAARQEAGKAALRLLHQGLENENIVDKWLDFRMIEGDTIAATATAEIHRDIGRCEKN